MSRKPHAECHPAFGRARHIVPSPAPTRRALLRSLAGLGAAPRAWGSNQMVALHFRFGRWTMFEDWASQLRRRVVIWWPQMTQALSSPGFTAPDVAPIDFVTLGDADTTRLDETALYHQLGVRAAGVAAITHQGAIHVNAPFLLARLGDPDMFGMMAHELTHVVQAYPHTEETWLVEGIADYVRYYRLLPYDPGRRFDPSATSYRSGYAATAGLLDWLERSRPGAVRAVNRTLRRGGDGAATLEAAAGGDLDAAWRAYLASGPAAASG